MSLFAFLLFSRHFGVFLVSLEAVSLSLLPLMHIHNSSLLPLSSHHHHDFVTCWRLAEENAIEPPPSHVIHSCASTAGVPGLEAD